MDPTKIIRSPEKINTCGFGNKQFQIHCDDGKVYKLKELAKIIGIDQASLSMRLRKFHWSDSRIFNKTRTIAKDAYHYYQESPFKEAIAGDLVHLSKTHNSRGERVYWG